MNKMYETARISEGTSRAVSTDRKGLADVPADIFNRAPSTAGKILKNSRMTPKVDSLRSSRAIPISKQNTLTKYQTQRKDRLHALELKKCDLMLELQKVQAEMRDLKEKGMTTKNILQQTAPSSLNIKKQNILALIDEKSLKAPKQLLNSKPSSRPMDLLKKQMDLQAQLRQWILKVPKKIEKQVLKIMKDKHQIDPAKLTLHEQQFDPFILEDPALTVETATNNLYLSYRKCDDYWQQNVTNKIQKEQVKQLFSKLDFDRQGVVNLKQFVREMSILLDKHLRNRDLYRIFSRLTKGDDEQKITCTQLLKVLSRSGPRKDIL